MLPEATLVPAQSSDPAFLAIETTLLRINNHQTYGNFFTYSLNPSYNIDFKESENLKIFETINSAFIAPSLYQLYDP